MTTAPVEAPAPGNHTSPPDFWFLVFNTRFLQPSTSLFRSRATATNFHLMDCKALSVFVTSQKAVCHPRISTGFPPNFPPTSESCFSLLNAQPRVAYKSYKSAALIIQLGPLAASKKAEKWLTAS